MHLELDSEEKFLKHYFSRENSKFKFSEAVDGLGRLHNTTIAFLSDFVSKQQMTLNLNLSTHEHHSKEFL